VDSIDVSRSALRRIAEKEPLDLARAALAIAHEEYPALDEAAYLRNLEVARRCGLAAEGVNFPGHFLCKVPLDEGELIVDPFHRGRLLGKDDLQKLLESTSRDARLSARHLRAASGREILARMLHNLRAVYLERHDVPRALSAVERLLVLAPSDTRSLRERADLYEKLGGSAAAAADLSRVLELEPGTKDAQALRGRVARLRGTPQLLN
jgi:regulator of sirC expression with transglutaminase-like and TPR domain